MCYVLDACALLAFLNDEEGGDKIEDLLNQSFEGNIFISMSIINLLEVYYNELRDKGTKVTKTILEMVQNYSLNINKTISDKTFHEAARLKTTYKISLRDCIGLATAIELSGLFVTSDHFELGPVAEQTPQLIFWFR